MAYENGRKINSYLNKKYHKDRQKKIFMKSVGEYSFSNYESFLQEKIPRTPYINEDFYKAYWQNFSTKRKKFARGFTHEKARAELVRIKHAAMFALDFDDILSINQSVYEKSFDYAWTVW